MPGEVEADKEVEEAGESTAPPEATAPAPPRPVVGIIHPPPEVRSILPSPIATAAATAGLQQCPSCSGSDSARSGGGAGGSPGATSGVEIPGRPTLHFWD